MASKSLNNNQILTTRLTTFSNIIEGLMWLGWLGWIMLGRDDNGELLQFLLDPLSYVPYLLSSMVMMFMELYGTIMNHRKTMIAAIAIRFIRVIIACLHLNNPFSMLPSQVFELVWSPLGNTLYIWDCFKIFLNYYLIPPSKHNPYESLPLSKKCDGAGVSDFGSGTK